jgi:hypothetical protein
MVSKSVTFNWQAMVQSFFLARELPWGGMPLDSHWSLTSCFHKIERVHRATYLNEEIQALSLFLLVVFNIRVVIYVSSGSGADIHFVPAVTCDDVAALNVEIRSSNSVPHIARFLSIQDISQYLIPLIPKSFSLCNFIPLSQLAVFKSPPNITSDVPSSGYRVLGEEISSNSPLPYSEDVDPLPVEVDVLILSNDLSPSSGQDLVSSVPQVLLVDEVVQPCDLLPSPNDELVLMNSFYKRLEGEYGY